MGSIVESCYSGSTGGAVRSNRKKNPRYCEMSNRHPYAAPDGFGGGVHHTRNQKATIKAFDKFYSWFPAFLDIFPDEEAFLNFAFWFVILTIVGAFIASRYIKIKPHQI